MKFVSLRAFILGALFFCTISSLRADMVTDWNTIALDVIRTNAVSPPKTGRDLAIVHLSMYDAWNAIVPLYRPFYIMTNAPANTSDTAALAGAAHAALAELYPSNSAFLAEAFSNSTAALPATQETTNGLLFGAAVAREIVALRSNDGWNVVVPYTPGTNAGVWRPTPPDFTPAIEPQWGGVIPFALTNIIAERPGPPPALTSMAYFTAWDEVRIMGRDTSTNRTADQSEISTFWDDPPGIAAAPAGKWNQIAQALAVVHSNSLAQNVRLFAMLNVAQADAGIVAWDQKYFYNFWRPITAIRLADQDSNPLTTAVTNWTPYGTSPGFPEYVSGHSTFSGAGAEILRDFYGDAPTSFTIPAGFGVLPGVTRSFSSAWHAAHESGQSRIYGGVHFQFANQNGLACGSNCGVYVSQNCFELVPEPTGIAAALIALLAWRFRRG